MQIPPLEQLDNDDDDGDVEQNGAKSAEVERKLDACKILAELLSSSAAACELSSFQREFKGKSEKWDKETNCRILAC